VYQDASFVATTRFGEDFGWRGVINIIKGERKELEEKAHSAILLSLSGRVLREVADEKTAIRLWKKVRKFVHEEISH
jgi:hypothetical protein